MDEEDEHFLNGSQRKCILLSGTECHIINYLLTELVRAVPGNIGPRAWLVRGYYYSTIASFYHIWSRERAQYGTVIHCSVPV